MHAQACRNQNHRSAESGSEAPLTSPQYSTDAARAEMKRLQRPDGINLAYTVHNAHSPRVPVLLSHGFGATAGMWDPNIAELSADRPAVVWDQRGHGRSDALPSMDSYGEQVSIEDMAAILDANGMSRAVMIGMSLGGYLSLRFNAEYPERVAGLVLVDTGPGSRNDQSRDKWNDWVEWFAMEIDKNGRPPGATAEYEQAVHDHPDALPRVARASLAQKDARVIESLSTIKVPTLVIVGSQDTEYLVASDYMQRHITGCRKLIIDDAGHASNMNQPDVFNTAVRKLLEEL